MNKYDAIKKSCEDFKKDWQDIIGPGIFDSYYAGYFAGEKGASADLAAAEERGRREAGKELRERARLLKAGDEFWNAKHAVYILPDALLNAKEAPDDGPETKTR